MWSRGLRLVLGLVIPIGYIAGAVDARSQERKGRDLKREDYERALEAWKEGKISTLSSLLAKLQAQGGGKGTVVEGELKAVGSDFIYKLKVLTPDNRISEVSIDAAWAVQPHEDSRTRRNLSQNEARLAVVQGRILPLREILANVGAHFGGEVKVAELELKTVGNTFVYELKIWDSGGRIGDVTVDATTGKIVKNETSEDK
ncbi:MAG: PepSY domain-containing protein [Hyphomicrobiaceae bacterium]